MSEKEIFLEIDGEARKLLTTIIEIKISLIIANKEDAKEKIKKAILLSEKIQAGLYSLLGELE